MRRQRCLDRDNLVLADEGHDRDRKTVANSMIRQGLCAKAGRKLKVTIHSKHELPVAKNILQQNFSASAPNQKWVGDITYLWMQEG
jgi:transposase InsO family protein